MYQAYFKVMIRFTVLEGQPYKTYSLQSIPLDTAVSSPLQYGYLSFPNLSKKHQTPFHITQKSTIRNPQHAGKCLELQSPYEQPYHCYISLP